MSLTEALALTASFHPVKFTLPPRSAEDVAALLDYYKLDNARRSRAQHQRRAALVESAKLAQISKLPFDISDGMGRTDDGGHLGQRRRARTGPGRDRLFAICLLAGHQRRP